MECVESEVCLPDPDGDITNGGSHGSQGAEEAEEGDANASTYQTKVSSLCKVRLPDP